MNQHLNVFRPYGDTEEPNLIENNLSRAFALCLIHDKIFFWEYLKRIVSSEDFQYLQNDDDTVDTPQIDIQQDMSSVEVEGVRRVYAIAMTSGHLDMADFFDQTPLPGRVRHVTDIWIQIKEIVLVIEVKLTSEDCKRQLFNQVLPFRNAQNITPKIEIVPVSFPWPDALVLMDNVVELENKDRPLFLLNDLLSVTETGFAHWFPSRPLSTLEFSVKAKSKQERQLYKRLHTIMQKSRHPITESGRRTTLSVNFGWANEIEPAFHSYDDQIGSYLVLYMWPGNTKTQGRSIYQGNLDWMGKDSLQVGNNSYQIDVTFNVKFCHFNGYITGFNFNEGDLINQENFIHTPDNYWNKSGLWYRKDWPEMEKFFDTHLKPEFRWRDKCKWDEYFLKSKRTQLTVSFGWEVTLWTPFSEIAALDTSQDNPSPAADFLDTLVDSMFNLIAGN